MRRTDREITDLGKIERIIASSKYLHLGMFDGDYPYVVPMHYGYEMYGDKLTFYVHCASVGHKLECITKSNNVFVEIDSNVNLIESDIPCDYSSEYESVMCKGVATIIENPQEKCDALEILMNTQTNKDFNITQSMVEGVTVIRIDVVSYTAKAFTR